MRILLVDNHDSFVYNIAHLIQEISPDTLDIISCDDIDLNTVSSYDRIILSPGPGLPEEAGKLLDLIALYAPTKPILGICLGHQAIAQALGCTLLQLEEVHHGIQSSIEIKQHLGVLTHISSPTRVGRYHSWVVNTEGLHPDLIITATDERGQIMAFAHRCYDLHGVQFHPESILTTQGKEMLQQFLYPQTPTLSRE